MWEDTRHRGLGASEILIILKRTQRSNTGCISHLRGPGTASPSGQEQNGFHLALLRAAVMAELIPGSPLASWLMPKCASQT